MIPSYSPDFTQQSGKKGRLVSLLAEVDSPENVENQNDGANFKQLSIFQLLFMSFISPSLPLKGYK